MISHNEEKWFKKFQEGTFMARGWKDRTKELLCATSPGEEENMRTRLSVLGEKIGREWARDNDIRKIDTAMLQEWGARLMAAKKDGPHELSEMVGEIEAEVENVLSPA
ncbi:MAG: hypothetical protein GXP53_12180 [Deltaproteobacteria bacterium]|nr:hypothetical protein [Deltaproteobacteria bacterium]